jgi:hypothetical protein
LTCDLAQSPPICVVGAGGDGALADDAASDALAGSCIADAQCSGGVCIEATGQCVDDALVIFVSPSGIDSGSCTRVAPCQTFSYAFTQVSATMTTIRVGDGNYTGSAILSAPIGTQVVISGEDRDPAGALVTNPVQSPAFTLNDGTNVLIEGITITSGGDAVFSRSQLTLSRVHAMTCGTHCVGVQGPTTGTEGTLRIVDSLIEGAVQSGVFSLHAADDIERTIVINNQGGGLRLQTSSVNIVNTVVANNGNASSVTGGIRIDQPSGAVTIIHDTIAYNQIATTAMLAPGVASGATFSVSNLILADNGASGTAQLDPSITASSSLFEGSTATQGTANRAGSPAFQDVTQADFHLTASSLAIDMASASNITDDIDGDPRPYGVAADCGADEYHP